MKLHTFFSLLVVSIIGFSLTACQSQNTPSSGLKKNTAAFSEAKEAVISDARQITFVGSKSGEGYLVTLA